MIIHPDLHQSAPPPRDCYHVWQNVQLTPGDPRLTAVCLACGAHLTGGKQLALTAIADFDDTVRIEVRVFAKPGHAFPDTQTLTVTDDAGHTYTLYIPSTYTAVDSRAKRVDAWNAPE